MHERLTKSSMSAPLLAWGKKLALAALCSMFVAGSSLAQETPGKRAPQRPAQPQIQQSAQPSKDQQPSQEAAKDPGPTTNLTVTDNEILFTAPAAGNYLRDIRLSNNNGGLRFYGTNQLTVSPNGAAIQFYGNGNTDFPGQLYLDSGSGAANASALLFRTAISGGTITPRMQINFGGNIGIGTSGLAGDGSLLDARLTGAALGNDSFTDGVFGFSGASNGNGVVGLADNGPEAYGVWGLSATGFAGFFDGKVQITGNLTKGGGSFKIDHPLDPENKYLSHSFVESPDMMNIYNGNVTTDAKGQATVVMPDYFASLNRDYRYQLTVIGQFAQAIVASEIKDNRFAIKTDKPNVKVSWQVTGVRQDAYANANRIPTEEAKPEKERGSYLHPAAFGQSAEKGIKRAHHPAKMPPAKEKSPEQASLRP